MNKRQLQIYVYIKNFISEKNYSPSIREIANAVGYSSSSSVHRHLDTMREKGYIDFIDSYSRTLQIIR
ncbi:helix-turn-helix domain-containing protein [Psychrobacillus sp. BM2]|uniref:LexA family protein n=1 Tax=Psychrobacillus sp. BM2 TaxID=3400421 RepID=UPI003B0219FA